MRGRGGLIRVLSLLMAAGCSHDSGTRSREALEPGAVEREGVRSKGGDSATTRIPILIARGQLQEAEELLKRFVEGGLISLETARRLQESIDRRKQEEKTEPRRPPPPMDLDDLESEDSSDQERTCRTELPGHPVCRELPEEYSFHSVNQALEAMRRKLGRKDLALHHSEATKRGPCPGIGEHHNVRMNGERVGSIVCCPCCVENEGAPLAWTKCRIVW